MDPFSDVLGDRRGRAGRPPRRFASLADFKRRVRPGARIRYESLGRDEVVRWAEEGDIVDATADWFTRASDDRQTTNSVRWPTYRRDCILRPTGATLTHTPEHRETVLWWRVTLLEEAGG